MASSNYRPNMPPQRFSLLRSITRMTAGGVMLGVELFRKGARGLEALEEEKQQSDPLSSYRPRYEGQVEYPEDLSFQSSSIEIIDGGGEPENPDVGLVMVGMMVDAGERAGRIGRGLNQRSGKVGRSVSRLVSPVTNSRVFGPFRRRFDGLVTRGEQSVERWQRMGEAETQQGQEILELATLSTVNTSIDYVTHQPEVVDLVMTQSTSATGRMLVYLRSIFVSVDMVIEGWLRSLARLKPRQQLQIPSEEVRQGAAHQYLREPDDSIDLETTRIGYYAGFASRAAGLVIDLLILAVIFTFTGWFLGIAIDMLGINLESVFLFMSEQWLDKIGESLLRLLTQSTMALLLFYIYHTLFWALFGQTFGSAIMGYRVVKTCRASSVRCCVSASGTRFR